MRARPKPKSPLPTYTHTHTHTHTHTDDKQELLGNPAAIRQLLYSAQRRDVRVVGGVRGVFVD